MILAAVFIAACDSNDPVVAPLPPPPPAVASTFTVSVTNLTNAQPLSPVALIAHNASFNYFSVGTTASPELETLAEGGDNSDLIAAAVGRTGVIAIDEGLGPIAPGGSETIDLRFLSSLIATTEFSVATMLVNTNDAFTGINGVSIATMNPGDVMSIDAITYDAGTEDNSETAVSIPGPAGGGEGFNMARDDRANQVTMHAGVVSSDDGFATSDLTSQHKFLNPVARIVITRID